MTQTIQGASAPALPPVQATTGALEDLDAALYKIDRLADVLSGIGNLLHPEYNRADEQLNMARRSDASAVFMFFGEVLKEYTEIGVLAHNTLQREDERKGGQHEHE
jgi:hypothetical protein